MGGIAGKAEGNIYMDQIYTSPQVTVRGHSGAGMIGHLFPGASFCNISNSYSRASLNMSAGQAGLIECLYVSGTGVSFLLQDCYASVPTKAATGVISVGLIGIISGSNTANITFTNVFFDNSTVQTAIYMGANLSTGSDSAMGLDPSSLCFELYKTFEQNNTWYYSRLRVEENFMNDTFCTPYTLLASTPATNTHFPTSLNPSTCAMTSNAPTTQFPSSQIPTSMFPTTLQPASQLATSNLPTQSATSYLPQLTTSYFTAQPSTFTPQISILRETTTYSTSPTTSFPSTPAQFLFSFSLPFLPHILSL